MKKVTMAAVVLGVLVCFSNPSFAIMRKDMGAIKAKILSVDPKKNEITVSDHDDGKEKTFSVKRGVGSLAEGNEVSIIYKLGTSLATNVTVKAPRK